MSTTTTTTTTKNGSRRPASSIAEALACATFSRKASGGGGGGRRSGVFTVSTGKPERPYRRLYGFGGYYEQGYRSGRVGTTADGRVLVVLRRATYDDENPTITYSRGAAFLSLTAVALSLLAEHRLWSVDGDPEDVGDGVAFFISPVVGD